jgi:hypothetical protein
MIHVRVTNIIVEIVSIQIDIQGIYIRLTNSSSKYCRMNSSASWLFMDFLFVVRISQYLNVL